MSGLSLEYDFVQVALAPPAAVLPPVDTDPVAVISSALDVWRGLHTSRQAVARRNKVQHQQDKGNDTACLQVPQALPLVHHSGALEVAHVVCGRGRAVARAAVGLLVRVAVWVVAAREGDGDAAARASEAEVGPEAGSSLAGGFNAAGHATRGGRRKRVLGLGREHRMRAGLHSEVSVDDGAGRAPGWQDILQGRWDGGEIGC